WASWATVCSMPCGPTRPATRKPSRPPRKPCGPAPGWTSRPPSPNWPWARRWCRCSTPRASLRPRSVSGCWLPAAASARRRRRNARRFWEALCWPGNTTRRWTANPPTKSCSGAPRPEPPRRQRPMQARRRAIRTRAWPEPWATSCSAPPGRAAAAATAWCNPSPRAWCATPPTAWCAACWARWSAGGADGPGKTSMPDRAPDPAARTAQPVRCRWCTDDPLYVRYHDTEWGVPSRDSRHLFEMLILEGFQAGLSWLTILRRREALRAALLGFDPEALARTDDAWVQDRMRDASIIRNRLKLRAAGANARAWLALPDPVG